MDLPAVDPLQPPPEAGRIHAATRPVRMSDVRSSGRLRLDGLTRYTQDVSNDDTTDAALDDDLAWVVRKTTVDVHRSAVFGEQLTLRTFASGVGRSWAERRIEVLGDRGGHYEVASLWVYLDPASGRPRKLTEQFHALYGEAARGRKVSARLTLPDHDPAAVAASMPWPTRVSDLDLQDHVNNTVYWAALEERLGVDDPAPIRFTMEYGLGAEAHEEIRIDRADLDDDRSVWWWRVGERTAATAAVQPLTPAV